MKGKEMMVEDGRKMKIMMVEDGEDGMEMEGREMMMVDDNEDGKEEETCQSIERNAKLHLLRLCG